MLIYLLGHLAEVVVKVISLTFLDAFEDFENQLVTFSSMQGNTPYTNDKEVDRFLRNASIQKYAWQSE